MEGIKLIQQKLKSDAAFLVSNRINIHYLTGFKGASESERESLLLLTKKAAYLIIPRLYATLVDSTQRNFKVITSHGYLDTIIDSLDKNITILEFEKVDLKYFEYEGLKSKLKAKDLKVKLEGKVNYIEHMRAIKTVEEIGIIRKAQELTEQTLEASIKGLVNGMYMQYTELTLAEEIRRIALNLGGEGLGFEIIVAIGAGSAEPHYVPQNVNLKANSVLLIDLGIKYKNYSGDLTRTFYIGEPTADLIKNYDIVRKCNELMYQFLETEKDFSALHKVAVDFFHEHKLDDKFIHSIGHGIGLEIHEEPFARRNKTTILKPGNVITNEPGLYFKGKYGIRIEDMILITEKSYEVLNKNTFKDLFTIT